jgi:hypothetical protein
MWGSGSIAGYSKNSTIQVVVDSINSGSAQTVYLAVLIYNILDEDRFRSPVTGGADTVCGFSTRLSSPL